jgi:hypothetical protein
MSQVLAADAALRASARVAAHPGRCFYAWWDRCEPCRQIQHYPDALRPPTDDSPKAKRLAAWIECREQDSKATSPSKGDR